jgi:Rps23 Pro-64 3,4-dihydroxylase Tpa1-like proline 4-hydroxylase
LPHILIDDHVADVAPIFETLAEEAVETYRGDIFAFDATPQTPQTDAFARMGATFAGCYAPALARITKKALGRADMRAYAYRVGHHLLPHTDHQEAVGRALAYAYYLPSPDPPTGGELELFACAIEEGEIVRTTSAKLIEPRPNRLVVFDVSDVSLHQVREITGGLRLSLAGWFHP